LWGYSVLTRDSGLYFSVLPIMLTIAIAIRSEDRFALRIGHLLVFVGVAGGMMGAYVMLNRCRSTGEAFFSVTGLQNWLRPVFDVARYGYAQPFTGDDLVSRTMRETMTGFGLSTCSAKMGLCVFMLLGLSCGLVFFGGEAPAALGERLIALAEAHDSRRLTRRPDREKPESPLAGLVRCTFGRLGN
ncbi:MAG: hypothetical protein WBW37_08310, partial [Methyloceanibacter sp.]